MALSTGMVGTASVAVTAANTAKAAGSGSLQVFGTPFMIALMEQAACACVAPGLEDNTATVGTQLNVAHTAATPVGMTVTAKAVLTAVEGRRLTFTVEASDEKGPIGSGTHERFIIYPEKFLAKTYAKLE